MTTKAEALCRVLVCKDIKHSHTNKTYGCTFPDCGCGTGWGTTLHVDCPSCGKFHFDIVPTYGDDIDIQDYEMDDLVKFAEEVYAFGMKALEE